MLAAAVLKATVPPKTCCTWSQPPLRSSATYATGPSRLLTCPPVAQLPGDPHETDWASESTPTSRLSKPGISCGGFQVSATSSATNTCEWPVALPALPVAAQLPAEAQDTAVTRSS